MESTTHTVDSETINKMESKSTLQHPKTSNLAHLENLEPYRDPIRNVRGMRWPFVQDRK